ncbi:MAG: chromosomal replication initiator protein DnaA [Candidatus Pacebacteria bacterium]|nr:chromosomal replication initiator protein DnaA [Candidatus Paceibacterota bacterium]
MNKEDLWQAVLAQIQFNVSQANFSTWFKNTEISKKDGGKIIVSVSNSFVKEWLENKYNKLLMKTFHSIDSGIKEVEYIVGKTEIKKEKRKETPQVMPVKSESQLDFQGLQINKETGLNPKYTFDSFIIGPFNELPHAAALAVVKNPGLVYNPLFIYGGVGLGKTHLLQSVGNEIVKNFSDKKVKYISSEKFTSEVITAIREQGVKKNSIETFKEKYRCVDVLIIDDIQFLSGKEKTQEEFFHIFNILYENNKQIIISSDRPPKSIMYLAERLRSRFEGGMTADISMPDIETRIAILKAKAQEKEVSFSEEIYQYIAESIKTNIRELEGALNRIIIFQKIDNKDITLEIAQKLLKTLINSPQKILTPKKIIQSVADFFDLKEREILAPSRKKEVVKPRQIAMYLLREELKSSFPFIGRKFNGKDHTTALHSYKKISLEIQKNKKLEEEIILIKERILSS